MFVSALYRCTKHREEGHDQVLSCVTSGRVWAFPVRSLVTPHAFPCPCPSPATLFVFMSLPLRGGSSRRAVVAVPGLSLACSTARTTEDVLLLGVCVWFSTVVLWTGVRYQNISCWRIRVLSVNGLCVPVRPGCVGCYWKKLKEDTGAVR